MNLASNPAGGYRAFFALACFAACVLVGTAAQLAIQFSGSGGIPEALVSEEHRIVDEQRELAARGAVATSTIQAPRTAEILDRTAFLNELLVRKGVSWTRTFLDLEQVLPPGRARANDPTRGRLRRHDRIGHDGQRQAARRFHRIPQDA